MNLQGKKLHNNTLGKWGENMACEHLKKHGYSIVASNFRTPEGEIDLIAEKDGITVFVEVKTRSNDDLGYPEEAISESKFEHMHNSAEHFVQYHPEIGENWRMDVISITGIMANNEPHIEWFEDVE